LQACEAELARLTDSKLVGGIRFKDVSFGGIRRGSHDSTAC